MFDHLGMELSVSETGRRQVHVTRKSREKWTKTIKQVDVQRTNRAAARTIGMILHGTRVREGSLRSALKTLEIARKLGKIGRNNWNARCTLPQEDFSYLIAVLRGIIAAKPNPLARPSASVKPLIVVAADASDDFGGCVFLRTRAYLKSLALRSLSPRLSTIFSSKK